MFKPIKTINTSTLTTKITVPQTTIKQLVTKSPFIYGAKKTSFRVKRRKTFWEQVETAQTAVKQQLIKSLLLDKSAAKEDITLKAVSPVLALTLILLNQGVEMTKTITDYVGDINDTSDSRFNPKVYAYNKYTYTDDNTHTVNSVESYVPSLPQYYHIHSAWVSKGVVDGSLNTTSVFRTDGSNTNLSQKQKDVRNYLWEQGFLRKIADNSYGNKNTDISYLRSGYGYGPVCISTFLKLAKFGKKMVPEVICGLLLCEDSGMTIKDAMQAVREFVNPVHIPKTSPFSYLSGLSEIMILSILEEIGTFFLLSLLGHCYKKNIRFAIPLSSTTERNIYEAGYLLGDTISDLRSYLIYILQNKLYKNDSIEVFSITSPCVMTSDGTITDSILETTFDTETFGDLSTVNDNPITSSFNISNTLNDLKEFDYLIQPRNGYSVSDFINKNLAKHYIEELIGFFNDSIVDDVSGDVIKTNVFSDYGIAPRIEETPGEFKFDYSKCTPLYNNEYYYEYDHFIKIPNGGTDVSVTVKVSVGEVTLTTPGSVAPTDSITLTTTGSNPNCKSITATVQVSDTNTDSSTALTSSTIAYIKSYIEGLVNDKLDEITLKYSDLKTDNTVISGTKATISVPAILVGTKFYSESNRVIIINMENLVTTISNTIEFSDIVYNSASTTESNVVWGSTPSGEITSITKFSCVIYDEFPDGVNPKILVNRLFRDNNCTLELYYKNIDSVTEDDKIIEQVNYFLDVYGLAISRIIIINCLCNSSLMSNDLWRKFFKTFSGYLRNYVDIEVSNLC